MWSNVELTAAEQMVTDPSSPQKPSHDATSAHVPVIEPYVLFLASASTVYPAGRH